MTLEQENERLRGLLRSVIETGELTRSQHEELEADICAALSQQAEPECRCTMRQRLVGDGCSVCNPEYAADHEDDPVEPAPAQDETLADRMRAAGMMTVEEMLAGAPLDCFIKHAGVNDLEAYGQWLDMKCREFLAMQAERDLNKDPEDDMYEWVIAHAAVFQEARINFNAARPAQTEQQPVSWQFYQDGKWWNGDDRIKDHRKNTEAAGIPVRDLYAAPIAQTAPQPEQSERYTCIGKGGEYQLIGRATTAGSLKMTGRFADEVTVYRDIGTDALYCQTPGDFRLRMKRLIATQQQEGSRNMEPEGSNAYLVVDPGDNYHICYVVRSKGQALQHATGGLLAFGPLTNTQ